VAERSAESLQSALKPVPADVIRRFAGGTLILEHERQHYVGLDLLRGVAAYGVILAHLHVAISRGVGFNVEPIITGFLGRAGVEVFFALSGFLIGGILCDLRERTAANYGIFLVRRWMRTLPLYYVAVWFFFAYPDIFEPRTPHKLWQYLTFTQNFTGQRDLTWFNVSWTLAVEEWFYALLTVSVAFATLTLRLKNGFICAVAFLIVLGITIRAASPMWGGLGVIGRLDAIAYGCLLAWLVRHPVIGPRLYGKRALVCVAAVLGIYATWIMERYGVLYWSRFNLVFHYVLWGVTAAGVRDAAAVVVAPDRDDSAVLITLTARELNPRARIVASVREEENAHLLRQGGADSVVVSSGAAGRLLGHAIKSPRIVAVLEDLLSVGEGLDITEREVGEEQSGKRLGSFATDAPIIAVVRGPDVLRFDDPAIGELRRGDKLVCLCTNR